MSPKLGLLASALCFYVGCSSASGPSLDPSKTNCSIVCGKVHDCVDSNADTDSCTNSCDSKSSDNVYKAKVEDCANCAEPRACSEVSSCAGDCLRIYLP
jgi:hypothetical protein